jgi:hypothetical protein
VDARPASARCVVARAREHEQGDHDIRTIRHTVLLLMLGASLASQAGSLTTDAAIGGALGGEVGAELGGRQGAIVGAGVGAAAGTAINTQADAWKPRYDVHHDVHHHHGSSHPPGVPFQGGGFCPPGQAKKGRC